MHVTRHLSSLKALLNPTTLYGLVFVTICWFGIYYQLSSERARTEEVAIARGNGLVTLFEQATTHLFESVDRTLLFVRQNYEQNPQGFDLHKLAEQTEIVSGAMTDIGFISGDGFLRARTDYSGPPIYVGDREHFKIQAASKTDEPYISAPVVQRSTGKTSILVTRRLRDASGFAGVLTATVDVGFVEKFHDSLKLGENSDVTIRGSDGILRASFGFKTPPETMSPVISDAIRRSPQGHVWGGGAIDGIQRLVSYRALTNFPLIITVGEPEAHIFSEYYIHRKVYVLVGSSLTILTLVVLVMSFRRRLLEERYKVALEQTNARFTATLANLSLGLCMFDADGRLLICNESYGAMYGLAPEQTRPGTPLRSILESRVAAGMSPEDAEKYIRCRLEEVTAGETYYAENVLSNGRIYAIRHQPTPEGGWVATHIDVTEQRAAERSLAQTKQFLDSIIENIPVSVVVKDAVTRKYILVNRAFEAMLDLPRSELLGRTVFEIFPPADAQAIDLHDTESARSKEPSIYRECQIRSPRRGERVQATRRIVLRDTRGEPSYLIAVIDDITERKKAEQRIAFLAHHDALTGLSNREALVSRIEEASARWRRRSETFSVLLLDLDRFKQVNDTLGHPAGDALLMEVAFRLKSITRETDVLARLGGDEFAIVQGAEDDPFQSAEALAGRIIEVLAEPFRIDGAEVTVGASIGIACCDEYSASSEALLKMADLALYQAKSAGRNRYLFYSSDMSASATVRLEVENDLRRAIQNGELELHYQPIVDAKTGKICGVEALVRWRHPVAEETGLITEIGDWVLYNACSQAVGWPDHVKVSVNLSLAQFRKPNFTDIVMLALAETGLPPERLELEVTETALIESAAECLPALRRFQRLGITIALDDFGTGYSSLSQLAMFAFDKIKIDKSFTQNMTKRTECAAIVTATLTLAKSLEIATTAEGVETVDQARILRLAGVRFLQGYLFQRPVPACELRFDDLLCSHAFEEAA